MKWIKCNERLPEDLSGVSETSRVYGSKRFGRKGVNPIILQFYYLSGNYLMHYEGLGLGGVVNKLFFGEYEWQDETEPPTPPDLSGLIGEPLESNTGYTGADVPDQSLEERAKEYADKLYFNDDRRYESTHRHERQNCISDYIAGALSTRQQGGDFLKVLEENLQAIREGFAAKDWDGHPTEHAYLSVIEAYEDMIEIYKMGSWRRQGNVKEIQRKLIWAIIEEWQDADDDEFSKNDIEADLYDWLKKIDEGNVKSPSSLQPGILQKLRDANPYDRTEQSNSWHCWKEACDTLGRLIEQEGKGEEKK
jgi:hypothetical protein